MYKARFPKEHLGDTWRGSQRNIWAIHGAVPKGTFGRYMARKRFEEIVRFLHFSDNSHADAVKFKTWKIKPVADTINATFKLEMTVGQRIPFDEGMIPMRSKYNPMRQYLRGKPHPWGTKCFLTCDADSGYCYRAEIYQGKLNSDSADLNQGPNAVIRNVEEVLEGLPRKSLIITDRFYSSVLLSSILLQRGVYHVGTIQTNRRGYYKDTQYKQAKRPKTMARGVYRIAQSKTEPNLIAVSWMDNRPVHFIATGRSTRPTTLSRRAGAEVIDVPALHLVKDYQDGVGGADIHHQLRLQRYSIQGAMKRKKYYHTIFLGFVDMALINTYIIYRRVQGNLAPGIAPPTHAEFQHLIQTALFNIGPADFAGDLSAEALANTPVSRSSAPRYTLPAQHTTKQMSRRQYGCKVYSLLRPGKNPWENTFYCVECSEVRMQSVDDDSAIGRGEVYLCQKVRQHDSSGPTNSATCSQIWHDLWRGGVNIPPGLKAIRLRAPSIADAQLPDGGLEGDSCCEDGSSVASSSK
ncbi:hypothetical protein F441_19293 [Phytophthora nicotianae CJ01A1]|uniref:PiggyBac transposable element-derived protein domain-containing protein n=1 Tax=Phytophthora nicotianae CJ01A1 TaxID=1317063 RepID=W2VZP6_PHYNI|nr:hypothetical protein F441_19293 [Phytophthora nicotianae CJ01A1]